MTRYSWFTKWPLENLSRSERDPATAGGIQNKIFDAFVKASAEKADQWWVQDRRDQRFLKQSQPYCW